ncbi:GntR family transcriptional regulator [Cupriavidus consociatus]|uniref:GntR family transcriptional regulator n=1 Tax=Cupriavidus consociatus TaxID=2821357 RepID=UPI001AE4AB16|nr:MULTISPECIES: GntR family transcriptional regulator [unclassified Cupriavidus]MBP0623383.1 GntR family transcriptional regulator [Cupriavidus sp. LEh25]MDK2660081.1 GntR family transcriptional regulator [Cupriavidus sp. LEh21]
MQEEFRLQERIKALIVQGEFEIGAKISEHQLAQRFRVGKARVRRALDNLAVMGFVQVRPRIGTFVFTVTEVEFDHLNAVRALLECAAIHLAMSVAPQRFIAAMRENIQRAEALALRDNYRRAFQQLDREFHRLSFAYADNPYLTDAYEAIDIKIWAMRSQLTFPGSHVSSSLDAHRAVFQQLETGEVELASQRLQEHIRKSFSQQARALLSVVAIIAPPDSKIITLFSNTGSPLTRHRRGPCHDGRGCRFALICHYATRLHAYGAPSGATVRDSRICFKWG